MSAPLNRETILVETVVDGPGITDEERRELIASLDEAQAQIARGEFVTFEEGMFERRLEERRASRMRQEPGSKS